MEEDSSPFIQWAMDMLLDEHPEPPPAEPAAVDDDLTFPSLEAFPDASNAAEMVRELMAEEADPANSWSSGDGDTIADNDGSTTVVVPAPATAASMDCYGSWPQSRSSFRRAPPPPPSSSTINPPAVSWNFVTGSAQPDSDGILEETQQPAPPSALPEQVVPAALPPARRACPPKGLGGAPSPAPYAPDHIIAERKRREKINKRLIELSTVVPGLKKMDKATILSAAAKYVKELQQRVKDLEEAAAAGSNATTRGGNEAAVVQVNEPGRAVAAPEENGSSRRASSGPPPAAATTKPPALPEIEARFSSDKSAMVRVHCRSGKGVAVAVIAEVEELGLSVVHANVMPSSAGTIIITITAKQRHEHTFI
ncbi:hypothetical protein BS78_09G037100 [Paspalum vaginatum]|nr:hypothetical protein BS78_09G037100 [Paspalum vaginatum]